MIPLMAAFLAGLLGAVSCLQIRSRSAAKLGLQEGNRAAASGDPLRALGDAVTRVIQTRPMGIVECTVDVGSVGSSNLFLLHTEWKSTNRWLVNAKKTSQVPTPCLAGGMGK